MDTHDVKQAAREASRHEAVDKAARVGYVVNGLMHLLIGWIALQVAWGTSGTSADQSGALGSLASNGFGRAILWLGVIGFLGLFVLYAASAIGGWGRTSDRIKNAGKAIVYLALAVTAFTFARGGSTSSKKQSNSFTETLLSKPLGTALVVLIGAVMLGVGVYHVVKGWKKKFLADLDTNPGPVFVRAGQVGYVGKGIALGVVGLLFVVAAVTHNPKKAGGLDTALRSLAAAPGGTFLLTFVALGFVAFGVYSFARARYGEVR